MRGKNASQMPNPGWKQRMARVAQFWKSHRLNEPTSQTELVAGAEAASENVPGFMTDAAGAADELGREPFAERIADALAGQPGDTSLVVGLYGQWGSGKSTVLDYVRRIVEEHYDPLSVIFIKFNPWLYDSEHEVVRDFFVTIARALGNRLEGDNVEAGKRLKRLGEITTALSFGYKGGTISGSILGALGSFFAREYNLRELRERLEILLEDEVMGLRDVRIIVAIDDLDRTDADSIAATLRLVKLGADLPRISYVLAFDENFVASALNAKYPSDGNNGGISFLEKIVQVPLHLPEADPSRLREALLRDLTKLLAAHHVELSSAEEYELQTALDTTVWPAVRTLRTGKRIMNAVAFASPLMHGNVRIVDLILLEALRTLYPDVYKHVGSHKRSVTDWVTDDDLRGAYLTELDEAVNKVKVEDRDHCKRLLCLLFPQVTNLYSTRVDGTAESERWGREQRVCSPNYFDRYFLYSLPYGDVPDTDIDAVVHSTIDNPATALTELLSSHSPKLVVEKLIERGSALTDTAALALAQTVCTVADKLPDYEIAINPISTASRAAYAVARLASRMSPDHRATSLTEMLKGTDARFAVVTFRLIEGSSTAQSGGAESDQQPMTADEVRLIGSALAERILTAEAIQLLYEGAFTVMPTAIAMCRRYASGGALPGVIIEVVRASPAAAANFLRACLGISLDLSPNSQGARAGYEYATSLVPPATLMECLEEHFPQSIGPFDDTTDEGRAWLELTKHPESPVYWVYRFAEIYRHYTDYPPLAPLSVYEPSAHKMSPFQTDHLQSSFQSGGPSPDFKMRVTLRVPNVSGLPTGLAGTRSAQMYGDPRERELVGRLTKSPVTAWFREWSTRQGVPAGAGWAVQGNNSGETTTLRFTSADEGNSKRAELECMVNTGMASAERGGNKVEVPSLALRLDFSAYGLGDSKLTLYGLAQIVIGLLGVIEPVEMIAQTLLGPSNWQVGELACMSASPREQLGSIVDIEAFRSIDGTTRSGRWRSTRRSPSKASTVIARSRRWNCPTSRCCVWGSSSFARHLSPQASVTTSTSSTNCCRNWRSSLPRMRRRPERGGSPASPGGNGAGSAITQTARTPTRHLACSPPRGSHSASHEPRRRSRPRRTAASPQGSAGVDPVTRTRRGSPPGMP
jgi:predicted KAP-like P-loop ATPase